MSLEAAFGPIDPRNSRRVFLTHPPFEAEMRAHGLWRRGYWPASWIGPARRVLPLVFGVRLRFSLSEARTIRVHVSADERYELLLDGRLIGRGPERGDLANWFFETFDLDLTPGPHVIAARVWAMGAAAPRAQVSAGPAFLLAGEGGAHELSTGIAHWEVCEIGGITPIDHPHISHDGFAGKRHRHDGRGGSLTLDEGGGQSWEKAHVLASGCGEQTPENTSGRLLRAAVLPPMLSRWITGMSCRFAERDVPETLLSVPCELSRNDVDLAEALDKLLRNGIPLTVPAHSSFRAVVDFADYYCAYTHLLLSGGSGACVKVEWAESLYVSSDPGHGKGSRDAVNGKYFLGTGDQFISNGAEGQRFRALWWSAGRYVQLVVRTGSSPLELCRMQFEETRYPLEVHHEIVAPAPEWVPLLRLCRRAIEVGSHEHFTDSPYYEQIGYIGDARIESLCWYSLTDDDRLVRKQLELIDSSRLPSGFTQSRAPCSVPQLIPPFSLIYVEMVNDFARHRRDLSFVRKLLPGVRSVLDAFLARIGMDDLPAGLPGWNFIDWAAGHFVNGEVEPELRGRNAPISLQLVLALDAAANLERLCGESVLALRFEHYAKRVMDAVESQFWKEDRRLLADTRSHTAFSQHTQVLALLTRRLSADRQGWCLDALLNDPSLVATTIYFSHYLFEVLVRAGRAELIPKYFAPWREATEKGLCCTPEAPEPSRSDSHAWAAHLLYHASQIAAQKAAQ